MKSTIFILAFIISGLMLTSVTSHASSLTGDSQTKFGNYALTPAQSVVINNVAYKSWELNYGDANRKYTVFYSPGPDGQCCFTVRNEKFEIQYAKKSDNFGVQLVDMEKRTMKKKDVMSQIDYNKFVNQLILTSNPKTEEEYLGLIACFMPLLFS